MEALREIHNRLLENLGKVYSRSDISIRKNDVIVGIVGTRGVGKTTYLLNYIRENYGLGNRKALYISADNIYFSDSTLVELVREFVNVDGGELICIDEIHRYNNWAQELKNIFDSFPGLKIIFSGSSSINIIEQKYDLSRRVLLKYFPGLSFREWLEFSRDISLPKITLNELLDNDAEIPEEYTRIKGLLGLFREYLRIGYYPLRVAFEVDEDYFGALMNAVDKVIYQDIGSYYSLKTDTLSTFKKILYFMIGTPPGKINANALAQSLGKYHKEVGNYLDMMRNSSLLRFLMIDKQGHALIRNIEKVFLDNTNLAYAIASNIGKNANIGTIRENFAINQLQNAGHKVFYAKKGGDLSVEKFVFEIGGAGKSGKQIKNISDAFVFKDDIVYKSGKFIPLYALGLLY